MSENVLIIVFPGLCQPRVPGAVGAEPFSAKLRYTDSDDPDQPNLIKLTVTMPHIDGECIGTHLFIQSPGRFTSVLPEAAFLFVAFHISPVLSSIVHVGCYKTSRARTWRCFYVGFKYIEK